ncbi:hypothetical protein [Nocardia seriolae]|uniref:hypothetical protein n=1 Tax=Nocardia seriolae TaxID=37332 RepID=UPI0018D56299|nr:hypothetical protein [Nocardia seriolae]QUN18308.1 hypothetical protein KEC46_02275 [Nocardia seriolae]WKY50605.1 hypothetical protein Q5P07_26835 [Nocardia seriolae]WNJ61411.1 hypothetical protein RMO66_12400 [Nocardia seriolae]
MSYPAASLRRMGLSVSTHTLADIVEEDDDPEYRAGINEELRVINDLLAAEGLPPHREPTTRGLVSERPVVQSIPYGFLHYLRRAYARAVENPGEPLTPVADGDNPACDPAVEHLAYLFESHLLCHSDCEGYYVPVDFENIPFAESEHAVAGGLVGSSFALLRELVYVAPYLGIELDGGELSDAELERTISDVDAEDVNPFYRERETWLLLFETARVSIANKTLITFS